MSLLLNIEMNQRSPPKVSLATSLTQHTTRAQSSQHAKCCAAAQQGVYYTVINLMRTLIFF